jgi:hypothetical protein
MKPTFGYGVVQGLAQVGRAVTRAYLVAALQVLNRADATNRCTPRWHMLPRSIGGPKSALFAFTLIL